MPTGSWAPSPFCPFSPPPNTHSLRSQLQQRHVRPARARARAWLGTGKKNDSTIYKSQHLSTFQHLSGTNAAAFYSAERDSLHFIIKRISARNCFDVTLQIVLDSPRLDTNLFRYSFCFGQFINNASAINCSMPDRLTDKQRQTVR